MATTAKVIVPDTEAKGQKRRKPLSKAHKAKLARRQITIERLRPWAEQFDALDDQRYQAQDFVRWLELELAPPAKPKEDCGPVYSLVGEGGDHRREGAAEGHGYGSRAPPPRP